MGAFLFNRLLQGVGVVWIVATLTFVLLRLTPGGPFDRERRLPPAVIANIEARYNLDKPLPQQYLGYIRGVLSGDLGPSYRYIDRGVNQIIAETLPVSVTLGILAFGFIVIVSFPAALLAAYFRNTWIDRACMLLSSLGIAVPHFILGALLIWLVALKLGWLQAGRWDDWSSAILPTITLGAGPAAYLAALFRSSLVDHSSEDFVRTARAKGLTESVVLLKHVVSNSLLPVLTVMGPLSAALLTGSFVVEYVFAIPGMGRFFITAVTDRDYPLIMGVTLVYTVLLVCANLAVDLLYHYVDPRIKAQ